MMNIQLYDVTNNRHEILCTSWFKEDGRYVFYKNDEIVAIFMKDKITGFMINNNRKK